MFIERKTFPNVNMSGEALTAKKSPGVSGVEGEKTSGSRLVATWPSPWKGWHCSAPKHTALPPTLCALPLCLHTDRHTHLSLGCWRELILQMGQLRSKKKRNVLEGARLMGKGKPVPWLFKIEKAGLQAPGGRGHLGLPCLSSSPSPKYQPGLGNSSTKNQNLTLGKTPKPHLD